MFEKIYLIHNPLTDCTDWVSEREFNVGSQRLKNVFGVLYIDDVKIMLRYNTQLKEAILKEYNIIDEKAVSLHHVCRPIRKAEFFELLDKEDTASPQDQQTHALPPEYPARIELVDGCFSWDEVTGGYKEDTAN